MKELIEKLRKKYPIKDEVYQRENLTFASVEKDQAVDLITHLRDYEQFTHLVILTAVDWIEENLFQLTYLLNSPSKKMDIGVRVMIDRSNPEMVSIHHLWAAAATYQRELFEMFGIPFPDSPRLKVPFILEGWKGMPPYRRDFDTLKYSEETFFPRPGRSKKDPAEHMKEMMYPEDNKSV